MTIEISSNSWIDLNPILPPGNTSQVFLGYDPKREMLMTWGGHLFGGGYPQIDDLYTYNIGNIESENTWRMENLVFSDDSDIPIGGCLSGGTYDPQNELMFKRGQHNVDTHTYHRKINLEKWPWIYDFTLHMWFDMGAFNYRDGGNYGAGVVYDTDNQIIMVLDTRNNIKDRTIIYDAYTNKVTLIPINTWADLGGTRSDMGLVYDSKRKRFIVVGGIWPGAPDIYFWYTDIWVFNLNDKIWLKEEAVNPEILPTSGWTASDAVYDSINDKIILFLGFNVNATAGDEFEDRYVETYAYDPETKIWEKLSDKPEHFCGHRALDLNAVFSAKHNISFVLDSGVTTKTWAYCYSTDIPLQTKPNPPENVTIETTQNSAIISWDLNESIEIQGYSIYRAQAEDPWDAQYSKINTVSNISTTYMDTSVVPNTKYFYYITSIDNTNIESEPSFKVRTQPRVVREGYVVVQNNNQTKVVWTPIDNDIDIIGYNVYRSECEFETYPINVDLNLPRELTLYERPTVKSITKPTEVEYIKINSGLVTVNEYVDSIDLVNYDANVIYPYKLYTYRIKAVNKLGVESGWSPYFVTIPNPPTGLKVSDNGDSYYLSWTPSHNGEGIKGYRVYTTFDRHDVVEITVDIINTTNVTVMKTPDLDLEQKFFITAIDLLDQEGSPSSGVWGSRIFKEFYDQYSELYLMGDLNDDGILDINDYPIIRDAIGKYSNETGYISRADYDNNDYINYSDFKIWYGYYKNK